MCIKNKKSIYRIKKGNNMFSNFFLFSHPFLRTNRFLWKICSKKLVLKSEVSVKGSVGLHHMVHHMSSSIFPSISCSWSFSLPLHYVYRYIYIYRQVVIIVENLFICFLVTDSVIQNEERLLPISFIITLLFLFILPSFRP